MLQGVQMAQDERITPNGVGGSLNCLLDPRKKDPPLQIASLISRQPEVKPPSERYLQQDHSETMDPLHGPSPLLTDSLIWM